MPASLARTQNRYRSFIAALSMHSTKVPMVTALQPDMRGEPRQYCLIGRCRWKIQKNGGSGWTRTNDQGIMSLRATPYVIDILVNTGAIERSPK